MDRERASGSLFLGSKPIDRIHPEISDEAMTPQMEHELVKKSMDGCGQSIGSLWKHYETRIFRYALKRLGNYHHAQDVVSEVGFKLISSIGKYEDRGLPFGAYVMSLTSNATADEVKRRYRKLSMNTERLDDGFVDKRISSDPQLSAEETEFMELLERSISALEPNERKVVEMRIVHGMDHKSIASLIGKSTGATRTEVHRAIKELRNNMVEDSVFGDEGVA